MTARQTKSATAKSATAKSASFEIGWGKPPRHTQFQKGRSGNPGGRPRREPVDKLKTLTLQEAYRGIVIKKDGGVGEPALAIEAILRSQIELAINGDVRAQRDILSAVRAYERLDAEKAAVNEYVGELARDAEDMHEVEVEIWDAIDAAPTAVQKMNYVEAAQRIRDQPGPCKSAARSGTGASARERDTTESDMAQRDAAPAVPPADSTPPPENVVSPSSPPAADQPAAAPRRREPRPDRDARHPARESTPPGAVFRAGRLRIRCLRHWTGHSAQLSDATWKQVPSGSSRRQKSGNSLLFSLFSGNPPATSSDNGKAASEGGS